MLRCVTFLACLFFTCLADAARDERIQVAIEEPANGDSYSGISNLRGWAVSPAGMGQYYLEIFIDGEFAFNLVPYGKRVDVGNAFPDYPNSDTGGFSMAYNYKNLTPGEHEIRVRAYDNAGNYNDAITTFTAEGFETEFIASDSDVDVSTTDSWSKLDKQTYFVSGATLEGKQWDFLLKWDRASQSFKIKGILPSAETGSGDDSSDGDGAASGDTDVSDTEDCPGPGYDCWYDNTDSSGGGSPTDNTIGVNTSGADGGDSGGDTTGDDGGACGVEAQIDFVEGVTESWYLWYDEMANVDKSFFDSAQAYLDARLKPLMDDGRDRGFSYLTTITDDETSISTGAYIGFGWRSDRTGVFIADVFESGPAFAAGVRRGMELMAVDTGSGFETLDELSARNASSEEVYGAAEVGVERAFRFRQNGKEIDISLVKEELAPPALAESPLLIERKDLAPVGYLHLRQFVDAALTPSGDFASLTDAARVFEDAGVTDLIIDLRYNGGGLLRVADTMMDLLGGYAPPGEASYKIQLNDQHPEFNDDRSNWGVFDVLPDTTYPRRIAFITSGSTASASELVINGLDPHIEVVLVGGNTFGKQVGQGRWDMYASVEGLEREDCDVALRLTAFEIVNGENQGGYHQVGLDGTGRFSLCRGEDDLSHSLGDAREGLVATALDWFGSSVCPSSKASGRGVPLANEPPKASPWLPIEYIPERVDESVR